MQHVVASESTASARPNVALPLCVRDVCGATTHAQVRVSMRAVGICGSDVHYLRHGRIGGEDRLLVGTAGPFTFACVGANTEQHAVDITSWLAYPLVTLAVPAPALLLGSAGKHVHL